jgi:tRNA(fMet)-specific endonuclease VapC
MFVLDTDILTHLLLGHPRVTERRAQATAEVALTVVTRIEVLQRRFAFMLKAEDGEKLLLAQQRLVQTEHDLENFIVLPVDAAVVAEFDQLRQNPKLKKPGGADILIAAVTLAYRATLVTRNVKDFRRVPGLQIENWAD